MRKGFALFLSMLIGSNLLFAQDRFEVDTVVVIRLWADGLFQTVLVNGSISIVGTDASEIEIESNEFGEIHLTNDQILPCTSYVITINSGQADGGWYFNTTAAIRESELQLDSLVLPLQKEIQIYINHGLLGLTYVFFDKNSVNLKEEMLPRLGYLAGKLMDSPSLGIDVLGHAYIDESNPEEFALKRAQIVIDHLVEHGLDRRRFVPISCSDTSYAVVDSKDLGFERGDTLTPSYIDNLTDSSLVELAKDLNRKVKFRVRCQTYYATP